MKEYLNKLITMVERPIIEAGFSKKGETDFVRKIKSDFNRQELFSFSARAHRAEANAIYVSCTIGIYYPPVRKMEKFFIDDHLFRYPIVAGSISHFSPEKKFLSHLYIPGQNEPEVISYVAREIEIGGFGLLRTFPDLSTIYNGIISKHPYLSDYYTVYSERENLTVLCIILVLFGKQKGIEWIETNYREGAIKDAVLSKLRDMSI
jgi:hypothetical protein